MSTATPPSISIPTLRSRLKRNEQASQRAQGSLEQITVPSRMREQQAGGLVAAARRLSGRDVKDQNKNALASAGKTAAWQEEAWELLDLIGEQRFLANTLAGRMSQAALYVGKIDPKASPGTRPEHDESGEYQEIISKIGNGPSGLSQIVHRLGINLFIAGEGWLVGIPPRLLPGTPEYEDRQAQLNNPLSRIVNRAGEIDNEEDVLNMEWRILSVSELSVDQSSEATLSLEDGVTLKAPVDELYMIRIWRRHPRRAWEADSPTRASLPTLRELHGLTQHVSAQVTSRLAGAGLLVVSTSASAALKAAAGIDPKDPRDPLMEALQLTMETAIEDRSSPSALVPITLTVPDEVVDKVKHLTFSTPLDKESPKLRDEAIRRLALSQDAPPELLLGMGGMNHWGAWLVQEDVVKTHLEPPLALICDAITEQYLRPILIATGLSEEEAQQYVVWYDVDHLIERPNRSQDAKDLHTAGVINDKALRVATGFEEGDAPEEVAGPEIDRAVQVALDMVARAPSLAQNPGLENLVEQLRGILSDGSAPTEEARPAIDGDAGPATGPPATTPADAPIGTPANADGGQR